MAVKTPPAHSGEVNQPGRSAFDVRVSSDHHYEVEIEHGIHGRYGAIFAERFDSASAVILTDSRVNRLYGRGLIESFENAGIEPGLIEVPEGESSKSMEAFRELLQSMTRLGTDRRTILVNFGGGVITDLGGFAASAYLRGIRYVNVATSLIAQLDAALGGKVAINAPEAKNFVGAFHHPSHVVADPGLLRTLSDRDFRSGLAEGIKVAMISSPELFTFFEDHAEAIIRRDAEPMAHVIAESGRLKMEMVSRDPYEKDLRRPLNFGHTIGHPIETEFGYRKIRHGEAVAIGMGVATAIALRMRLIEANEADRIYRLLHGFGLLGFSEPIRPDRVVAHMQMVRLVRAKHLHFVLPERIGEVKITDDVSTGDLVTGFEDYAEVVQCMSD